MSKPLTLTDAVGLLRRSQLLDADTLRRVAERAGTPGVTADSLFGQLVHDKLLTAFQARQLAAGRWRGLVLHNYKLLARIGSGGMGQVFLGEHVALGRRVAVKVLSPELATNATARARLVREARAAAALDHPNIVHVFDIDADANPPYLVMEYIDGVSLQAAVAVSGTFRAEAAAAIAQQVAIGLQHAWENGLVHRDVKPANLLLDRRGGVHILDLGIVRVDDDNGLTSAGGKQILGTVDYLAPEQALDSSTVDCRADVYGLGASLYFLLAGHPPFSEGSPGARLMRKQTADPMRIHLIRPDVPGALSNAIAAMLARQPADRPPTPAAAAELLAPFAQSIPGFPDDVFAAVARERPDPATPLPSAVGSKDTPTQTMTSDPRATIRTSPSRPASPAVSARTPVPAPSSARNAPPRRAGLSGRLGSKGQPPPRGNAVLWLSLAAGIGSILLLVAALLVVFRTR